MGESFTAIVTDGTLEIAGNTGLARVLPVTVNVGQIGTTVDTDATGAFSYAHPEDLLSPGTVAVKAICQPPVEAIVLSTTVVVAYPPGLTVLGAPAAVGMLLALGTPTIVGSYINFPFTGSWAATTAELVNFFVDGVGKSSGWHGPTGASNVLYCPLNGLASGPHTAEVSIGNPVTSAVTWNFVYEPTAATPPSSGGGSAPAPADTLITRPNFPASTAAGQLGTVMQRANGAATPAAITTTLVTFSQGKLPAGSGVTLGGAPAQLDVHTTWLDKSARAASLTAHAPALATDAAVMPMLTIGSVMTGAPPALALPAGAVTIDLTIGGVAYAYDVGTLLKGVMPDWLNGPLAVQGCVSQVVTGFLRLLIDVVCYADGNWNVAVGFAGDLAFEATSPAAISIPLGVVAYENLAYGGQKLLLQSVVVKHAGAVAKQVTNLTQYQYTVWNADIDSRGTVPAVPEMTFDVVQHSASGLMPRFDMSGVSNATIAGYYASMTAANGFGTPSTPPATPAAGYYPNPVPTLGWGGHTLYMGQTGGRSDIGQATDPCCAWAITLDKRMREFCEAQAEGIASAPWHLFVRSTGRYINNVDQPKLWTATQQIAQGSAANALPADQQIYGAPWALDAAHMPNACLIPYLLTGRRRYLREMLSQAAWCVMSVNARGLMTGDLVVNQGQGRGMAWCFRQIVYASLLAADADPLLPWLRQAVENNVAALNAINTTAQGELATYWCYPNGLTGANGAVPGTCIIAPWQNDFQQLALTVAADCKIAGAAEALSKCAGFTAGRFLPHASWYPQDGSDYYYTIFSNGALLTTWAELQAMQVAGGASANGNNAVLPPNCSLQYVAYARQTLIQMARVLTASGYTAAAAQCTEALAFVTQQANTFGAGDAFAQANPSFAITG
jgi:hypothetical protein